MARSARTLRTRAEQASQQSAEVEQARKQRVEQAHAAAKRQRAGRIGQFVSKNAPSTIQELHGLASQEVQKRNSEAEKVWTIAMPEVKGKLIEPTEELMKHRALSAKVAEHFVGLGLSATIIDERVIAVEHNPEEGGNYLIGVKISWAEPE